MYNKLNSVLALFFCTAPLGSELPYSSGLPCRTRRVRCIVPVGSNFIAALLL